MNHIDTIRATMIKDFSEKDFQRGDFETFLSPSKRFRLDVTSYLLKDPPLDLTNIEIFDQTLNEKIFDFFVNESHFFHGWVSANDTEYLLCAEDIFGGQTVIDMTHKKMNSYSPPEDGFIWTDFYVSPDGKTLATIGCYWACPYVIKVFDFSEPLNLPLREIQQIELLDNDEVITGWLDNETLNVKGFVKEHTLEGCEGRKKLTQDNTKREIKIDIK